MIGDPSEIPYATKDSNFHLEVGKGKIAGYSGLFFTGDNNGVTNAEQTLMARGGTYLFPTSATTLDVVSSSANDTLAGTGANAVVIIGLDSNRDKIIEVVSLAGTTIATTTLSFLRVNSFVVIAAGSNSTNEGTVNCSQGVNVLSQIGIGEGQARQAVASVPNGFTWFAQGVSFSAGEGDEVEFFSDAINDAGVKLRFSKSIIHDTTATFANKSYIPFPQNFDVLITVLKIGGGQAARVSGAMEFFEVENSKF